MQVLIIEDDPDTRENLRDILEMESYEVLAAGTLGEAFARRDWNGIGAILLDRRLPDGTAETALPRFHSLAPEVPVIIMTGYADISGAIAALRQGAADYILKPIEPSALAISLAGLIERQRTKAALREAEQALRRERDFAETLIQQAQAIVLVVDWEGRIVRFNPFMEQLSDYRLDDLRGKDYFEYFTSEPARTELRAYFEANRQTFDVRDFTSTIVGKNGIEHHIRWAIGTLHDVKGEFVAVQWIGHDITELLEAQRRSLQAERLAAIGEMMAGLTHESRNALQRSKACLEMLALEVQDRPDAIDLVQRVERAQEHLQRLYEEVRSYAAPINLQREVCDLASIWRDSWDQILAARPGRQQTGGAPAVEFVESLPSKPLMVRGDRFALGQVFRNVFENALAVMPAQGKIELRGALMNVHGRPWIRLSIRDNGPGMTPEQRRKIFEPFYTTKTKGTGLGMAIVKRIVQAHGGDVTIGDSPGGAEINLQLPCEGPSNESK